MAGGHRAGSNEEDSFAGEELKDLVSPRSLRQLDNLNNN